MKMIRTTNRFRMPMPLPEDPAGGVSPPPPPAPPPPAPAPGGPAAPDWAKEYPDEVKTYVVKNGFPDPVAGLKSAMHLEKLVGAPADQLIRRPAQGFETDPKPHLAALDVLGRPKEAKAYGDLGIFKPIDGLGELAPETQKAVSDAFHEIGILPWQAPKLMDLLAKQTLSMKQAADATASAAAAERAGRLDAYKAELGGKFEPSVRAMRAVLDKFDKPLTGDLNELKAKGLVKVDDKGMIVTDANGNPIPKGELGAWLDETQAGNDPRFLRMFTAIAERFDPSSLVTDGGRTGEHSGAMTKSQAAERERQLRADPNFMRQFTSKQDPGHKEAVAQMLELSRIQHS